MNRGRENHFKRVLRPVIWACDKTRKIWNAHSGRTAGKGWDGVLEILGKRIEYHGISYSPGQSTRLKGATLNWKMEPGKPAILETEIKLNEAQKKYIRRLMNDIESNGLVEIEKGKWGYLFPTELVLKELEDLQ